MKKLLLLLIVTLTIGVDYSFSQITISPTNLFIEENTKFGTYLVINGSNEPQEVSVDFIFAYTTSDNEGTRSVIYDDAETEAAFSAHEWVRAFPKTFTLQPGQRQIVRLRVSPTSGLDDGTYWARIKTSSSAQTPPVELQESGAVSARVGITIEQITGLFYKKGNVTTGINVTETRTEMLDNNNTLAVISDYVRGGNSPFLGSITLNIKDSGNKVVASSFRSTSLYFDGTHRQEVDISNLPNGSYSVELIFEAQRNDVSADDIVPMDTETVTTQFVKS